mgnify:CR=1 FL=1
MVNVVMTALVYLLTMVMSYILKRAGLFHKEDKKVLSNLIFYITLPASLISSFTGAEVNVYYVIAILLGFLVNTVMVISYGLYCNSIPINLLSSRCALSMYV